MNSFSNETTEENAESKLENNLKTAETIDPDYVPAFATKNSAQASLSVQQQGAKENTVKKIKSIVRNQFALEMRLKEQEIETVDNTIRETKIALDRIRACVLARYYGMSQTYPENDSRSEVAAQSWTKPRLSRRDGVTYIHSRHTQSRNFKSLRNSSLISSSNSTSSLQTSPKLDNQITGQPVEDIRHSVKVESLNSSTSLEQASSTNIEEQSSSIITCTSDGTYTNVKSKLPQEKVDFTNGDMKRNATSVSNLSPINTHQSTAFKLKGNSVTDISSTCTSVLVSSSRKVNQSSNVMKDTSVDINSQSSSTVNSQSSSTVNSQSSKCSTVEGNQPSVSCPLESHLNASANMTGAKVKVTGFQETTLNIRSTTATEPVINAKESELGSSTVNTTCVLKSNALQAECFGSGSRFYVKKRVIIGNTSKYVAPDKREDNDKSTHKWMVYVRGPPEDPHIDTYIQKVWFFLHPSYRPNDIVEINKPPFHLTRRGWGEFPIRVQIHFVGSRNKRVDIIHELRLDKTYTGLQTLGAETVVDLEIDRKTFEDLGIPVSLESPTTLTQAKVCSNNQVDDGVCSNNLIYPEVSKLKRELPLNDPFDKTKYLELPNSLQLKKLKSETPASSAMSTPSVSKLASRCSSPVSTLKEDFLFEEGLEEQLHILAEKIPVITPKKGIVNLPFRAESATQFFGWNVGKRRAAEWQRALKIRNQIRNQYSTSKITTKDIMVWCRRNAYTPQSNLITHVHYCKICGRQINEDETAESCSLCPGEPCVEVKTTASTLTPPLDLLSQIEMREKLLEITNRDALKEDVEVDVVGLHGSTAPKPIPPSQNPNLLTTPLTPGQQWIKDVCNNIGIRLKPQIMDGVEVHTVESAVLVAAIQFTKQLMRSAMALGSKSKSSLDSKLLVPKHIYEAINSLPHCDFLSNAYLGVDNEDQ